MDTTTSSIMEYEITKLNKKISKLESTVKTLQKENSMLHSKINNLEDIILKISSELNINFQSSKKFKEKIKTGGLEETWLYYIPLEQNLKKEAIQKKLKIEENEDLTYIDLKADWKNETEFFSNLMKHFENFNEFSQDFQSMSLDEIIPFFQDILEVALMSDTIIVIRNIPLMKDKKHDIIMASIAKIAGIMYKVYNKVAQSSESIGKMALVVESKEELNIININNEDSRIVLSIEKL